MSTLNTRASPVSDVDAKNAINAIHARAYPRSDVKDKNQRSHSQVFDKLRLASWNLGTMTGRSSELSEILKHRQINVCCVQETKWKGSKSRDIGNGYQLVYHGTDTKRNGVGIVLDDHLKQRIINVERKSDRIIAIKLAMDGQQPLNIISVYAPQTGCPEQEKQDFWEDLDEVMQNIPPSEFTHLGGDLNGHVGQKNDLYSDVHGGCGFGSANQQGIEILNFATKHFLKIINTYFQKKPEHLITYKCSKHSTQIDYLLASRNMFKLYKDCKVIPGNALTSQHRLLVSVMRLPSPIRTHSDRTESIKWKELHTNKGSQLLEWAHTYVLDDVEGDKPANQMWADFEKLCLGKAKETLGVSRGALRRSRETSWWNEGVKDLIAAKRDAFKMWQKSNLEEDRLEYKSLKKIAKSAVAQSIAKSREDFYNRLENAKDENTIYKIARQRHKSTLDIKSNKYIKNDQGRLLTTNKDINRRWKEYYEQLMNEEFPSETMPYISPTEGPIRYISPQEVLTAISKMKYHKANGPDQIPADIWKKLKVAAVPWLTKLFNRIVTDGKIPESWRNSILCPLYKQKGDIAQCGNYRGVKLTSHTLKMFERIIASRISDYSVITENQFGFTPGKSTIDAIQTIRVIMEKHRANKENLYLLFIDLEKAFDRVPRNLVWQALRAQNIPEHYVQLIQDMYRNTRTQVKSPAGLSDSFHVKVGVHQGSALSPLLFNLCMDYITRDIQSPVPECMLYADDIVLMAKNATELQDSFNQWTTQIEHHGLRISRSKTEYLECDYGGTAETECEIRIDNRALPKVDNFKYLGSVLTQDANVDKDVDHRINTAWLKWRSLSGVLCDHKMPVRVKGKIYKTVVRPALTYGAECWTIKKAHEQRLHTNEMKMLRWAGGVTRLDKIKNEYIRGSFKVAPIVEKVKESRMRWYGHIHRRNGEHPVQKALDIKDRPRGRGRPPATWWTNMQKEMQGENLSAQTTQNRALWRKCTGRPDPR